jgi:hypothetical protein
MGQTVSTTIELQVGELGGPADDGNTIRPPIAGLLKVLRQALYRPGGNLRERVSSSWKLLDVNRTCRYKGKINALIYTQCWLLSLVDRHAQECDNVHSLPLKQR